MTPRQVEVALALERCTFTPGSAPKRFVRWAADVARAEPDRALTDRAAAFLNRLAHSYRRQLGRCMADDCVLCQPRKGSTK